MDQNELIENIEDEILNSLPEEALERLAAISEKGDFPNNEVREVLKEYGIDANDVAKKIVEKGEQENA